MARMHCPAPLATGQRLSLPAGAARHVQVLRMQPGGALTLFNGEGGEYEATVTRMGRSDVEVEVGAHHAIEREAAAQVHLAVGMPANERMDWLVEKAAELGAASIQPLVCERSVLRLAGERAAKKQAHWQAVAIAACEQCGRNRVPVVHEVVSLEAWLRSSQHGLDTRFLLSPEEGAAPLAAAIASTRDALQANASASANHSLATAVPNAPPAHALPGDRQALIFLSGPEGGLSPAEAAAAQAAGFAPVSLGPRVLRAETAPLAALVAALSTLRA
jgi:16S rRNA (uracil1498-N3)-methyltransferase